jgi:hypothetical protein
MESQHYKMIRTVFIPQQNTFTIQIPDELISKRLELLILPLDFLPSLNFEPEHSIKKRLKLTTYQCQGKIHNFSRADAYRKSFK